jgi:hypothetical protein
MNALWKPDHVRAVDRFIDDFGEAPIDRRLPERLPLQALGDPSMRDARGA